MPLNMPIQRLCSTGGRIRRSKADSTSILKSLRHISDIPQCMCSQGMRNSKNSKETGAQQVHGRSPGLSSLSRLFRARVRCGTNSGSISPYLASRHSEGTQTKNPDSYMPHIPASSTVCTFQVQCAMYPTWQCVDKKDFQESGFWLREEVAGDATPLVPRLHSSLPGSPFVPRLIITIRGRYDTVSD